MKRRRPAGAADLYGPVALSVALIRLYELGLSRGREQRHPGPRADPEGYPFMVALHLGLFLLPPAERRIRGARIRARPSALAWVAAASALRWWSIRSLGEAWNVRGQVSASLDPVSDGPYRFVRHPNYLAVAIEVAALPLLGGATVSSALLSLANAAVLRRRILAEEELLDAVPGYPSRFQGKARFIPGIF